MSIEIDAMHRDLDRWCAGAPYESGTADLDGCVPTSRPSLWRRIRCRLGWCTTLVIVDHARHRSLASEPARCIDCGRAHLWVTPERLKRARAERCRRAGLYWMID